MSNATYGAIPSGPAEGQAILSGRAEDQATNRGERKLLTRIYAFGAPMLLVAVFLVAYHLGEIKGSNDGMSSLPLPDEPFTDLDFSPLDNKNDDNDFACEPPKECCKTKCRREKCDWRIRFGKRGVCHAKCDYCCNKDDRDKCCLSCS